MKKTKTKQSDQRKFISAPALQRKFKFNFEFCKKLADYIEDRFQQEGLTLK